VRLTFDREICAEPFFRPEAVVRMTRPARVFPEFVVLELKFTTRFPNWFRELVRRFNLMQFSSAKYCEGVEVLGWHWLVNDGHASTRQSAREHEPAPARLPSGLTAAMAQQLL
jgi:hypothetical protein